MYMYMPLFVLVGMDVPSFQLVCYAHVFPCNSYSAACVLFFLKYTDLDPYLVDSLTYMYMYIVHVHVTKSH